MAHCSSKPAQDDQEVSNGIWKLALLQKCVNDARFKCIVYLDAAAEQDQYRQATTNDAKSEVAALLGCEQREAAVDDVHRVIWSSWDAPQVEAARPKPPTSEPALIADGDKSMTAGRGDAHINARLWVTAIKLVHLLLLRWMVVRCYRGDNKISPRNVKARKRLDVVCRATAEHTTQDW